MLLSVLWHCFTTVIIEQFIKIRLPVLLHILHILCLYHKSHLFLQLLHNKKREKDKFGDLQFHLPFPTVLVLWLQPLLNILRWCIKKNKWVETSALYLLSFLYSCNLNIQHVWLIELYNTSILVFLNKYFLPTHILSYTITF